MSALLASVQRAVIGVVGGCGGVGASRFAAVLAAVAAGRAGRCLLVELDPLGGGLDVALGVEGEPGARWSQLHLAGGSLDAEQVLSGLPQWGRVALLAGAAPVVPAADQVGQVLDAAGVSVPVVVDLGRCASPARAAALVRCSVVVLVGAADLAAVTAARSVLTGLDGSAPVLLVARASRWASARTAALVGLPLMARLPSPRRRDGAVLSTGALPRVMRRVARGLVEGLADSPRHSAAGSSAALGWVPEFEPR